MTDLGHDDTPGALTGLDPILNAPKRLAIMAVLVGSSNDVDFGFLKEYLGISDSDLSKQAAALQDARYVEIVKTGRGRGSRTRLRRTLLGTWAYRGHHETLQRLLGGPPS